jgi:O-antigen ligase
MNGTYNAYHLITLLAALLPIPLLAVFGVKGLAVGVVFFGTFVLLYLLFRFHVPMLGLAVLLLGIGPFYWGIDVGGLPKVFADEALFLLYAGYFILACFVLGRKKFTAGDPLTAGSLGLLIAVLLLGFLYNDANYIAFRNFIETYVFGAILYFLFVNEVDERNADFLINVIIATTLILSMAMLVERATNYNFLMARLDDALYLSPELAEMTKGVYRPYATFFHPSEAGLFVAMGIPFVIHRAREDKRPRWGLIAALAVLAVIVNYTRGVWLAVGLAAVVFNRKFRRHLLYLVPLSCVLALLVASAFQDVPFAKRLTDPTNLMTRFFYWDLAWDIFKQHFLLGIGHMNFKEVYLDFVRTISLDVRFDVGQIFVADSVYLTTMVEAGILGLAALLAFWTAVVSRMPRLAVRLREAGSPGCDLPLVCLHGISIYLAAGLLADVHHFTKATKFVFVLVGMGFALTQAGRREGRTEGAAGTGEGAEKLP